MGDVLKDLGIGLSRLLRYSYAGFLLITFASIFYRDRVQPIREAMGWELAALAAVVVGAGIYAVHRSIIVPLQHASLCLLWWLVDSVMRIEKAKSANPTRWLGSLGVPLWWRITAYTVLRRSKIFEEEKSDWDIAHAETGLVLMTAEAFLVAAILASTQISPPIDCRPWAWSFLVLFVFSYAGFVQHAVECGRFKDKETDVKKVLDALGMRATPAPKSRELPWWAFLLAGIVGVGLVVVCSRYALIITDCKGVFLWISAGVAALLALLLLIGAWQVKKHAWRAA
jgi:hypothetical protein